MSSTQKQHLAFCLEYPIHAYGGTEVLVAELIRGLSDEFAITLVSADEKIPDTWVRDCIAGHIHWNGSRSTESSERLAAEIASRGVRLAHFHFGSNYAWNNRYLSRTPALHLREKGVKCLSTNHGFFSPFEAYCAYYRPAWFKLALFPAAWLSKVQTLLALECEIAVSQYDFRALRRWYWPVRNRFRQIYHSKIHAEPTYSEVSNKPRAKRVLCVGTFGSRKGQPLLAEAFSRIAASHPEWQLVFAGRVPEPHWWTSVEEHLHRHGVADRVQRLDGLSHEQIAELMATSEIFVMPSSYEGLGLSLQEALFHGCACVSTQCGGPEDMIVHGHNGLLVPKGSASTLAAALSELMSNADVRQRFQRVARESVVQKGMTAECMIASYRSLYRSMLQ